MSFRKEIEDLKETGAYLKPFMNPLMAASLIFHSGAILELISDQNFKRGVLPEPFDFPSHIGNTREAAMGTVAAYAMIGITTCLVPLFDKSRELFKRNVKRAAVGAFAVSSAIQVAGEKLQLTNDPLAHNTGDMLDAAYGIGWSGVVAAGAYMMITSIERNNPVKEDVPMPTQADIDSLSGSQTTAFHNESIADTFE